MTPQKTKLQIIEELFDNYYVKDPSKRAAKGSRCSYYQESTGNKCAVGMCMLNDDTAKHYQNLCPTSNVHGVNIVLTDEEKLEFDDIIKEEYRGHDLDFWDEVQCLHDNNDYWTEYGLSEQGIDELRRLKETNT